MPSHRPRRVGEEIRKVLSERLVRGLRDPLPGFVTIREVEVTKDFTRAKVFYSVIGSDDDKRGAQEVLDRARGMLRSEVGKKVRLRNTPELFFVMDESGERAARIHKLLGEVAPPPPAKKDDGDEIDDDADDEDEEDDEDESEDESEDEDE